ncbi:MAG: tetratricopeptide repeat protein [Chitinophagaceae bacterium]|nr:tetratricopeptide repeat protein [Chitinophagaceae bacterium]
MKRLYPYNDELNILKFIALIFLMACPSQLFAQKQAADSLLLRLANEKVDTVKATLYWKAANLMDAYDPDSAMYLAGQGLKLSRRIHYEEGESRALGIIANALNRMGNYPKALEYYFEKLKIEERRKSASRLSAVLMNIGIVYVYQENFDEAMKYYRKSDSMIQAENITDFKYNIALNVGDLYDKTNRLDSAMTFYQRSLLLAVEQSDADLIGTSRIGIGNIYAKKKQSDSALLNYRLAIEALFIANDEDLVCEGALGMAKVFHEMGRSDSVKRYAHLGLFLARKDKFLSREYELSRFLTNHYAANGRTDSAYYYLSQVDIIRDSLESKESVMASQQLTFNEQIRQLELAEKAMKDKEERRQQIQLIMIGMFIPALFFLTVLLTRIRIPLALVKFLGVISLLFFFEYLTLLLHPVVKEITHHTPVFEILIFVAMAAILIPAHHRIEHWVMEILVKRVQSRHLIILPKQHATHPIAQEEQSQDGQHSSEANHTKPSKKSHRQRNHSKGKTS